MRLANERPAGDVRKAGRADVFGNAASLDQARTLAILGQHAQPERNRLARALRSHRAAFDTDVALDLARPRAEQRLRELRASCADEAEQAENLTPAKLEARVLDTASPRPEALVDMQSLHAQHRFRADALRTFGAWLGIAADHGADELRDVALRRIEVRDDAAVAHHDDPVGNQGELVQPMGDVDASHVLCANLPHPFEQMDRLGLRERRRRLVQDEDAGCRLRKCRRDGHQPLGGWAQLAHRRIRIGLDAEELQSLRGEGVEAVLVHDAVPCGQHAHEHVVGDAEVRRDVQFLRHQHDAGGLRLAHVAKGDAAAVDRHLSLERVAGIDPGDDLHQRGLARAVLADDGQYLARADLQVHVRQRRHAGERLADPAQLQSRRADVGTGSLDRGARHRRVRMTHLGALRVNGRATCRHRISDRRSPIPAGRPWRRKRIACPS